jgi:hypothetical protein
MSLCDDIVPWVLEGGGYTADSFPSVYGILHCILPRPDYLSDAFVTRSVTCKSVTCRLSCQISVAIRPSKFFSVHEVSYHSRLCTLKYRVRHKINDRKKCCVMNLCIFEQEFVRRRAVPWNSIQLLISTRVLRSKHGSLSEASSKVSRDTSICNDVTVTNWPSTFP